MSAGHGHHHHHGVQSGENLRRLWLVLGLSAAYMLAEVIGGLVSNSLALLADAGHMLSDVGAISLSLFAIWIARKPADSRRTYGYHRTEILAALANGGTLIAVSIYIFVEAWRRLHQPPLVHGPLMMAIALGGLAVNLGALGILHGGRGESLNMRGVWLHTLTDALGSLQAVIAGAVIWAFGWRLADPIASAAIGVLVVYSSWALVRETLSVLMESAPGHIDVDEVRQAILGVHEVRGVHDLHVWTITSGRESLSAHVVAAAGAGARSPRELLSDIRHALHDRFGIHHVTIQVEAEGAPDPCEGCDSPR
ncbi:MAG TPA: cation diffusion facilitator family transporter [Thermoanaerobaculia bacterium]|nr:cation diffusion facilitator family transporter [Thermoanaerobaculia bacterium]